MTEWRDISTAPKEIEILVWGPRMGHHVVEYDAEGTNDPDFPWHTLDGPSYFKNEFICWMPLPLPPEGA